jgi:hypothetical protein
MVGRQKPRGEDLLLQDDWQLFLCRRVHRSSCAAPSPNAHALFWNVPVPCGIFMPFGMVAVAEMLGGQRCSLAACS